LKENKDGLYGIGAPRMKFELYYQQFYKIHLLLGGNMIILSN